MKRIVPFILIVILMAQIFLLSGCIQTPEIPIDEPDTFTVTYLADAGGYIVGPSEQTVKKGEISTTVVAVPYDGYKFDKWSDGYDISTRTEINVQADITVVATFSRLRDPNKITFYLDYNLGVADNAIDQVTFVKDNVSAIDLPVPTREHFTFAGWYCDEMQVSDEQGKVIVGNEILDSDKASITAKWTANETFSYKVLLVYVTRVKATLEDCKGNDVDVDYTMSAQERQFFHATTSYLEFYLEEMMDGMVDFQVDEYFTTQTVTDKSFFYMSPNYSSDKHNLGLWPYSIPEMTQTSLMDEYDSVLVMYALRPDYYPGHLFNANAGNAEPKYGMINFDECWGIVSHNGVTLASGAECMQNNLTYDKTGNYNAFILERFWISTWIHELAHTIEDRVKFGTLDEIWYRSDTYVDWWNELQLLKAFYFEQAPLFDEKVGIPYDMWAGNIAKIRVTNTANDGSGGSALLSRQNDMFNFQITYNVLTGKRDYIEAIIGTEVTIAASPYTHYKFASWSDGVTDATRRDVVTEDMTLTAIFEPIGYTLTVHSSEGGTFSAWTTGSSEREDFDSDFTYTLKIGHGTLYVMAKPNAGYRFVGWSNGDTSSTLRFDFTINTDIFDWFDDNYSLTLTPIFEKIE